MSVSRVEHARLLALMLSNHVVQFYKHIIIMTDATSFLQLEHFEIFRGNLSFLTG